MARMTEEERKQKNREHYHKNKREILVSRKKYYKENIEKIKAYAKKHREKNTEKIKLYIKKYREENKDKLIKLNNALRARNRKFVQRYLRLCGCKDCGIKDSRVLESDHVRGVKNNCISNMISNKCSIAKLKKELRNCVTRCANCHRIKSRETNWATCVKKPPAQ